MQVLILSRHGTHCMGCGKSIHGTWMAYWGFPLDERMSKELKDHVKEGLHSDQWWRLTVQEWEGRLVSLMK